MKIDPIITRLYQQASFFSCWFETEKLLANHPRRALFYSLHKKRLEGRTEGAFLSKIIDSLTLTPSRENTNQLVKVVRTHRVHQVYTLWANRHSKRRTPIENHPSLQDQKSYVASMSAWRAHASLSCCHLCTLLMKIYSLVPFEPLI